MECARLLIVMVVLGSFVGCLSRTMEQKSPFEQLENVVPAAAHPDDLVVHRTKRQMWGDYGIGGGMRGLLWGLVLSNLFTPAPPPPK